MTASEFSPFTILFIKLLGIAFALLMERILLGYLLRFLHRRLALKNLSRGWGYDYLLKADGPIHFLIYSIIITYAIQALWEYVAIFDSIEPFLHMIRSLLLVGTNGWLLLQWKNTIQIALLEEVDLNKSLPIEGAKIDFFGKLVSIVIALTTILSFMSILNYPLEGIITVGGIGAAAIAFASQGVISNFFGSAVIYLTNPFSLGDLVALPKEGVEGTVEQIGWYLSCIRNPEKQPIYIPNALFSSAVILNYSRMTHRRIKTVVSIRYMDTQQIEPIVQQTRNYLLEHPAIDQTIPIITAFSNCNTSSLDIEVVAYTIEINRPQFLALQQEILLKLMTIVKDNGADMPFPTQTIELAKS